MKRLTASADAVSRFAIYTCPTCALEQAINEFATSLGPLWHHDRLAADRSR